MGSCPNGELGPPRHSSWPRASAWYSSAPSSALALADKRHVKAGSPLGEERRLPWPNNPKPFASLSVMPREPAQVMPHTPVDLAGFAL